MRGAASLCRALLLVLVIAGVFTQSSLAHTPKHSKSVLTDLDARLAFQKQVIRHDKHVIRFFTTHRWLVGKRSPYRSTAMRELRFHTAQMKWTQREMKETLASIRTREVRRLASASPVAAIQMVFGSYASQALAVARCESGLSVWATNGQYLGLFQMGSYARAAYGHSNTALGQARAAYNYFVASGRNWSPWECKPW